MDQKITFQEVIIGSNESNEDEETGWQDIATNPEVWANVEEKSGTEEFKADQLKDVKVSHFTIRYRSDLNAKLRIVYLGVNYDIQTILEIGRRRYLKIVALTGIKVYQETVT